MVTLAGAANTALLAGLVTRTWEVCCRCGYDDAAAHPCWQQCRFTNVRKRSSGVKVNKKCPTADHIRAGPRHGSG
jgi:hypothetical protein